MKRVPFFDNPVLRGQLPTWRARLVLILLFGGFTVLAGRALFLQGLSTEFLQQQGERRYERTLTLSATRGKIMDRNGAVLASSVPARAIWAIPEDVKQSTPAQLDALAKLLEMPRPICGTGSTRTRTSSISSARSRWRRPTRSSSSACLACINSRKPAAIIRTAT